jgi:hypothetical protein|tara:strand:- start:501 stop:764 length:264 start_codon:yes stop_codon:yes gene_type:complete
MTVKTDHGNFNVNPITFKARRELHKLELKAVSATGEINASKFFDVLDWVLNFAFADPESKLGKLDDNAIDSVLMKIYNAYKEPSKKK